MALMLSGREIGIVYTLLRKTNDNSLEIFATDYNSAESADANLPKTARLNKLIVANLRHKLQNELAENS